MDRVIGILGGMGPEATLDCFAKIIRNTPAERDQDHLRVVIDSNPKVPDRTAAILGRGDSPLPVLVEGCRALERAGADFIAAAESLVAQGAEGIIAGCTEIPLALRQEHLCVTYFDSVLLLAREAIRQSGMEPVPMPQSQL